MPAVPVPSHPSAQPAPPAQPPRRPATPPARPRVLAAVAALATVAAAVGCGYGSSLSGGQVSTAPKSSGTAAGSQDAGGIPGAGTTADGTGGTGGAPAANATPATVAAGAVATPADDSFQSRYTLRGRFDLTDPAGPRYAWPNSAVGATFTGTQVAVRLADPLPTLYNGQPVNNRYNVVIDGGPPTVVAVQPGAARDYPVGGTLAPGQHTLWLTKRTEANIGRGQFLGLTLAADGTFLAPPPLPTDRFIEFIGDSVSSGYGVDGNYRKWNGCTFSVDTADSPLAYPEVAAGLLAANFHNLAFAGKGITRNLSPNDPVLTMPVIYGLWDPRDAQASYGFDRPAADVVVITIGGNDYTGDNIPHTPPDLGQFVSKYLGLIQQARQHAPQSTVLCCLTPMTSGPDRISLRNFTQAVVDGAAKANMADVRLFEFTEYDGKLGYGCDGHPSAAEAAAMARELATAIRAAKGW